MISSYSSMFLRCLSHWPHHFGSASPWPCRGHGWHGAEAWRGAPRLEVCLQIAKYMGKRCENDGKMMENDVSMMEKWWGNDVKMMGKRCENDGKMMGNDVSMMEKWWGNDVKMMGKRCENDGKMMENDVKMVEWWKMKWCEMLRKWWGNDGTWCEHDEKNDDMFDWGKWCEKWWETCLKPNMSCRCSVAAVTDIVDMNLQVKPLRRMVAED